jgi:hypothetical protein
MRTSDSLEQCAKEVFGEVDQTIDDGYCDKKESDLYYERMKKIDIKIKGLGEEGQEDLKKYVWISFNNSMNSMKSCIHSRLWPPF